MPRPRFATIHPFALLVLAFVTAAAGCARSVELNTDPGESYAINVINERSQPMIVSFDDGSGTRLLGTVSANQSERFVIAGSGAQTVSIIAEDEGRTFTVRRTVALRAGGTVDVRL